jgi:hypothetical protein
MNKNSAKYYIDYNQGIVLKNLIEDRFKISDNFSDKNTHFLRLNESQSIYYEKHPHSSVYDIWNMTEQDEEFTIDEIDNIQ